MYYMSRPPSNCVDLSQKPKFISTMASPEDSVDVKDDHCEWRKSQKLFRRQKGGHPG